MKYIRDKRSPIPKSESVSKVMSANKNKNTLPEMILRKGLWEIGLRGYRLHHKNLPGKPDISYISKKIALFINGCFWHRCPHCNYPLPKNNKLFWKNKFERNIQRDKIKISHLEKMGWKTLVLWECEIKSDLDKSLNRIKKLYNL